MLTVERLDYPASVISLGEVKAHYRSMDDWEDDLLATYTRAATRELEMLAGLAVVTQTIRATFSPPPISSIIPLPVSPVLAGAEAVVTLDGEPFTDFTLITGLRPAIRLHDDELCIGDLVVTYEAGFGSDRASVPDDVALAIMDQVVMQSQERGQADHRVLAPGAASPHFARIAARYRRVAL